MAAAFWTTMLPEPKILPVTDKASAGEVVPIPTLPQVVTLKMLVEVATEKSVAAVEEPITTYPVPASMLKTSLVPKVEVAILNLLESDWSTPMTNLVVGAAEPVLKTILES